MADREAEVDESSKAVANTYKHGNSEILTFIGEHGSGKTHLLQFILSELHKQQRRLEGGEEKIPVTVYLQNPRGRLFDLYTSVVDGLGKDLLTLAAARIIVKNLLNPDFRLKDSANDRNLKKAVDLHSSRLKRDPLEILSTVKTSSIPIRDITHEIVERMNLPARGFDYGSLFLRSVEESKASDAWMWLAGDRLSREQKQNLGVQLDLEQRDSPLLDFSVLLRLLGEADYEPLIMLLDELETLAEIRPITTRIRYYDQFRHFIDDNPSHLCIIATVTPSAMALMFEEAHPLTRRMFYRTKPLDPFDPGKTKELVVEYLKDARNAYAKEHQMNPSEIIDRFGKKFEDPQLAPFSSTSIAIVRSSVAEGFEQGNIGEVLRICGFLLDAAIDENANAIDDSFIKKHLPTKVEQD